MTNLEMLKTAPDGAAFLRMYSSMNCGCRQYGKNAKEIWQKYCLTEGFRGKDGCQRCRAQFFDMEYNEENREDKE